MTKLSLIIILSAAIADVSIIFMLRCQLGGKVSASGDDYACHGLYHPPSKF